MEIAGIRLNVVNLPCCPLCKSSLSLRLVRLKDQEVLEGVLYRSVCRRSYEVSSGTPRVRVQECFKAPSKLSTIFYNAYARFYDPLESFLEG